MSLKWGKIRLAVDKVFYHFRFKVRISDTNLVLQNDDGPVKNLDILQIYVHDLFEESKSYYDMAILRTRKIRFSPHIRPVCLPSSLNNDYEDKFVELIGWGSKNIFGASSASLQRVALTVFPQR